MMRDESTRAEAPSDRPATAGGISSEAFKAALSGFASGVTVITTGEGRRLHGMTATAFASVSLDPPLILVVVHQRNRTAEIIRRTRVFAVNVLADHHQHVASYFASRKDTSFGVDVRWQGDVPVLHDALSWLSCSVHQLHEAGDHVIVTGLVRDAQTSRQPPLLYFRGDYAKLT